MQVRDIQDLTEIVKSLTERAKSCRQLSYNTDDAIHRARLEARADGYLHSAEILLEYCNRAKSWMVE